MEIVSFENVNTTYPEHTHIEPCVISGVRFSELKMQYTDMEDAADTLKNIPGMEMYAQAARCYLQNQELSNASNVDYAKIRDHYMAENIDWIYEHVQKGNESMLMISGHNGHVAKKSTYTTFMGEELFEKYGDDYFVIGTDFYKTECNLPGKNGKRITRKFYSVKMVEDRAISYFHPDFVIRKGEMHHKRRYKNTITLSSHFYGENITDIEKETARELLEANADNYDGVVKGIYFYKSAEELEGIVL